MKTVYIIRHAKSSWKEKNLPDFQRPLNKRGQEAAPLIGRKLQEKGVTCDRLYSSPAVRALQTARLLSPYILEQGVTPVETAELYDADVNTFFDVLKQTPDTLSSAGLVAHNPTINQFINELFDDFKENIPTSAVFALQFECDHWIDIDSCKVGKLFYIYPKLYTS